MSIQLYQYGPSFGLPDLSPFCIKVDAFLRMNKLEFESKISNPRASPKGKLPYIEHNGQCIADSSLILDYLIRAFDLKLDAHLTPAQKAIATACKSMLEEHYYFIGVYFRWADDAVWNAVYKSKIMELIRKAGVPGFLLPLIVSSARKGAIKSLHAQGLGRHSSADIAATGCQILDSVSVLLGDKPFFLGEQPTSIDATVYAFLSTTTQQELDIPLRKHAKTLPNLQAYVDRFYAQFYA